MQARTVFLVYRHSVKIGYSFFHLALAATDAAKERSALLVCFHRTFAAFACALSSNRCPHFGHLCFI